MVRIFFIVAIVCGIFTHEDVLAQRSSVIQRFPSKDTIIFKGSTVQIGARLKKNNVEAVEIENFGVSKKKDLEKGFFFVKVSPKKTTTYRMYLYIGPNKVKTAENCTIYVVTSEEEKKTIEEKMMQSKSSGGLGIGIMPGSVTFRVMKNDSIKKPTESDKDKK